MTPDAFLDEYFGREHIDLDRLSPELEEWIAPWLAEVRAQAPSFVLPRRKSGSSGFYAIALTDEEERRLLEQLRAFVAPSHGHVGRSPVELDEGDPVDVAVRRYAGARCWRVVPVADNEDGRRRLRDALDLMRRVRAQRPAWRPSELRPLGRVLRDFESALFRRDADGSANYLTELERGGLLSLENLRFMHVRRLASLGLWDELRKDERFLTLLEGRRPAGISDLLLETLWHTEVVPALPDAEPRSVVRLVRQELVPRFGPLFSTATYARSGGAMRIAVAFAVSESPPRRDLIERMLTVGALEPEGLSQLEALAVLAPRDGVAAPMSDLARASVALEADQPDLALDLLRDGGNEDLTRRAELLVTAAFALGGLDAASAAAAAVADLSEQERQTLPSSLVFRRMLEWAETTASEPAGPNAAPVTDWESWVAAVDANPGWTEALASARRGASEWEVTDWVSSPSRVESLAHALTASRETRAAARVRDALGPLVEFVGRLDTAGAPVAPLLDAVHQLLVLEERHSPGDLALLVELTTRLLAAGRTRIEYRQLIEDLVAVWTAIASYERLEWALQVLDVLGRFPAPDPEPRIAFLTSVAAVLQRSQHRTDDVDLAWFSLLAAEYGMPDLVPYAEVDIRPPDDGQSPWRWLDEKSLGVHCLLEPAAQRAVKIVKRLCSPTVAEVDTSLACTDKLRGFCSRCDVIVVVTQHAKHAATDCIKSHTSPKTILVWPEQRTIAASGIVRALRGVLEGLSES